MTFDIVDALNLAYLNRQGLVHRNLSPTNILVSPEVNNCYKMKYKIGSYLRKATFKIMVTVVTGFSEAVSVWAILHD